jgi:N-glycosylase/DNA lyase
MVAPFEIEIPIDSRLEKIYTKYNVDPKIHIRSFYQQLSQKTGIPPLHLDGIIWTNIEEFMR